MKRIITSCLFCFSFMLFADYCFSQDLIILKSGDEISSKVLEVTPDIVKYKKWANQEGPIYSSSKAEIFMIKYANGTKDVFKIQESNKINIVPVNNEDLKKNEALRNLENYVSNTLAGPSVKVENFRKTNGTMNNFFGKVIYEIDCDIDLRLIADGWKKGNGLEGYWSDSYVYPSEPDLTSTGEQYMYTTKHYPRGTLLTLSCVAKMKNTDNGFQIESFSINSVNNHGIQVSPQTYKTEISKNTSSSQGNLGDNKDGIKQAESDLSNSHVEKIDLKYNNTYSFNSKISMISETHNKKDVEKLDVNLYFTPNNPNLGIEQKS